MSTLVDIPEEDLTLLNKLVKRSGSSRAQLIRQAICAYLEPHKLSQQVHAFGLWSNKPLDGLAYQQKIRSEW